jgi:hypothetical protein
VGVSERDGWLEADWRALVAEGLDTLHWLMSVDECGANGSLSPLYAWSRRGYLSSPLEASAYSPSQSTVSRIFCAFGTNSSNSSNF